MKEFQSRGLAFFVWTINPPDRIRHYLDLGVDGIVTDRPDVFQKVIQEREGTASGVRPGA